MPVLADLPHPAPAQGLVYFLDDAWPGAPSEAGFVISDWDGSWHPIPFATLAGFLLINKNNTTDMKSYLSVTTADVTGLSTALATKANSTHTHTQLDITDLVSDLSGKAPTVHTHVISNVTGLETALDGKASVSHTHPPSNFGGPTSRTLSLATAYQATDSTKPSFVTINLTSTANFSLIGGTTNSADIVIGSTNAVASGTGTVFGKYANSITGTIAIGLNMNSQSAQTYTIPLPVGWYFAVRQTSGTVTITSAFDQSVG